MENNMEITIVGYKGLHKGNIRNNGKEHGNHIILVFMGMPLGW